MAYIPQATMAQTPGGSPAGRGVPAPARRSRQPGRYRWSPPSPLGRVAAESLRLRHDHQLPPRRPPGQAIHRLHEVGEGVLAEDHRSDGPPAVQAEKMPMVVPDGLRLEPGPIAPVDAAHTLVHDQHVFRRDLRDRATSEADDHAPPLRRHAAAGTVEHVAAHAHGVEDHVRPASARNLLDQLDEIRRPVVDGHLGAQPSAEIDFPAPPAVAITRVPMATPS